MTNDLIAGWIDTPLGPMIALSTKRSLCFLGFAEILNFEQERIRLEDKLRYPVVSGDSAPIRSIFNELDSYFKGKLQKFQTPCSFEFGTPFQKNVWNELAKIPYGKTRSYAEIAAAIGKPTAYRAAAQANGANPLILVIPCHRVINTGGKLGGYGAGLNRKQWLLDLESNR